MGIRWSRSCVSLLNASALEEIKTSAFFRIVIMFSSKLFVAESIHQGQE